MTARKLALGLTLAAIISCAPRADEDVPPPQSDEQAMAPTTLEWVPAAGLPPGGQMAVVAGNPAEAGEFTVQLRFPDDYRVPPHTHPSAETVRVVSGLLHVGRGGTFDLSSNITELRPGQSVDLPGNDPHFAHAVGETIIEVRSTGPFQLNYVNPADNPGT